MTWPPAGVIGPEGALSDPYSRTDLAILIPDLYDPPGVASAVKGTATLDFGSGAGDASVAVTGQLTIEADSSVEAWIELADSADHTADEHRLEEIEISAGNIVAGTGFTIYGVCRKGAAHGEFNINWVWA